MIASGLISFFENIWKPESDLVFHYDEFSILTIELEDIPLLIYCGLSNSIGIILLIIITIRQNPLISSIIPTLQLLIISIFIIFQTDAITSSIFITQIVASVLFISLGIMILLKAHTKTQDFDLSIEL